MKYLKQKTAESEKTYKDYKNLFNKKMLIKKQKDSFYVKKLSKLQVNTKIMKEIAGTIKTCPKALKINKKLLYSRNKLRMNSTLSLRMYVLPLLKLFCQSQQVLQNI